MMWRPRRSAGALTVTSEHDALTLARDLCAHQGLPWKEPVRVRFRRGRWVVWTNADKIGGNVEIVVNARTGDARRRFGPLSR